jgi:crotonobetainyl-CoA:carnitine CoA-transferase CaiB-like acyl-CoA transferase
VWVSITGYGRHAHDGQRIAFGDDAAVAGGLITGTFDDPTFCADAVADPLTGLATAGAVLDRWRHGGSWLLDASMSRVAAWCARAGCDDRTWDGDVPPPRFEAAPPPTPARSAGHDSATFGFAP